MDILVVALWWQIQVAQTIAFSYTDSFWKTHHETLPVTVIATDNFVCMEGTKHNS